MSYQRNKDQTLAWQKWLRMHCDELIACGVPHMVLENERHWKYFLEHGHYTPVGSAESIIDIDRLSNAEKMRLCLFLEQDDFYPECATLNRLQSILKR